MIEVVHTLITERQRHVFMYSTVDGHICNVI